MKTHSKVATNNYTLTVSFIAATKAIKSESRAESCATFIRRDLLAQQHPTVSVRTECIRRACRVLCELKRKESCLPLNEQLSATACDIGRILSVIEHYLPVNDVYLLVTWSMPVATLSNADAAKQLAWKLNEEHSNIRPLWFEAEANEVMARYNATYDPLGTLTVPDMLYEASRVAKMLKEE